MRRPLPMPGLAPTNSKESALSAILDPGAYTAIVERSQRRDRHRPGGSLRYQSRAQSVDVGRHGRGIASVTELCGASLGKGPGKSGRISVPPTAPSLAHSPLPPPQPNRPHFQASPCVARPAAVVPPGVMTIRRSSSGESPLSSASCAAPRTVCVARLNDTSGGNPQLVPPAASASITV